MITPAPPTDSLYKYLAISGLALMIVSAVAPWGRREEVVRRWHELQSTVITRQAESAQLQREARRQKNSLDDLGKALQRQRSELDGYKREPTPAEIARIKGTIDSMEKKATQLQEEIAGEDNKIDKALIATHDALMQTSYLDYLQSTADTLLHLAIAGISLGAALAATGFWLWYRRIQRLQDELLRLELDSKRADRKSPADLQH